MATLARSDLERYLVDWADRQSTRIKGKSLDELGNGQMQKTSPAYLNLIWPILKYFFKWLYQLDDTYPECVRWIKTRSIRRELDPRDILTEDDVYKLVRAAPTTRDKALIHVLYESGARINELQQRILKDISFEYIGEDDNLTLTAILFIPSRDTGIVKERGKYLRLIDSAPILQAWLQDHPNPEPDQPLWVSLHSHFGKRLGRSTLRKMLKRVAKQCGVTKPVHLHAFRHAQVTRSAKYLSDQQLKQKFGWAPDSQMLKVYSHLTTQDVEEKEFELRGITPKQGKHTRVLTQVQCARCHRTYSAGRRLCECGRPLDPDLAARWDQEQLAPQVKIQQIEKMLEKLTTLPDDRLDQVLSALEHSE